MKNLVTILCLCLFWCSCASPTESEPEPSEIDINWMLVKTPNMESQLYNGIGYYFYFTSDSNITNLNLEEGCENHFEDCPLDERILNTDDGILSFTYNGENFNFYISDSYIPFENNSDLEIYYYLIETELNEPLQRIIYNQEMNYFTLFRSDGFFGIELNSSNPNELIDYR